MPLMSWLRKVGLEGSEGRSVQSRQWGLPRHVSFWATLGRFARCLVSAHLVLYGWPVPILLVGSLGQLGILDCSEGLLQPLNFELLRVWGRLRLFAPVILGHWDQPGVRVGKDTRLGWFE